MDDVEDDVRMEDDVEEQERIRREHILHFSSSRSSHPSQHHEDDKWRKEEGKEGNERCGMKATRMWTRKGSRR